MNLIGTRIKNLRDNAGLTQEYLSYALHIDRSTLAKYESGHRKPDIETLCAIANHFNVSLDYLVGRKQQ